MATGIVENGEGDEEEVLDVVDNDGRVQGQRWRVRVLRDTSRGAHQCDRCRFRKFRRIVDAVGLPATVWRLAVFVVGNVCRNVGLRRWEYMCHHILG